MGIDIDGARFLIFARLTGVDFSTTATIGRQRLHLTQREFYELSKSCGRKVSEANEGVIGDGATGYSENFFQFLGAKAVHSFDYSDYENPTYTHDMNEPISEGFKDAYTAVLDGGSLEHIFNFPTAIRNCMEMVKVGGHYLAMTPANNCFGHGFYQFSPELYFTVLSAENGFQIEKIIAYEETAKPTWYIVKDPRIVAERVTLRNSLPVYLLIIAKKTARAAIFERAPQQSDYVARWSQKKIATRNAVATKLKTRPLTVRIAKTVLPARLRQWIRSAFPQLLSVPQGFDSRFFERFEWPRQS
jgi:hypothetical protein